VRRSEGHVYIYLDDDERQFGEACGVPLEPLHEQYDPEIAAYPEPEISPPWESAPRLSLGNSPNSSSETEEEPDKESVISSSSSSWKSDGVSHQSSFSSLDDFIDFRPEYNTSGAFNFWPSESSSRNKKSRVSAKLQKYVNGRTRRWFRAYTSENLGSRLGLNSDGRTIKKSP
jgi:hypothetical protein